jgi:hypothetical protein
MCLVGIGNVRSVDRETAKIRQTSLSVNSDRRPAATIPQLPAGERPTASVIVNLLLTSEKAPQRMRASHPTEAEPDNGCGARSRIWDRVDRTPPRTASRDAASSVETNDAEFAQSVAHRASSGRTAMCSDLRQRVELRGIEPLTSSMPWKRSAN